jgi:hypothetical protein
MSGTANDFAILHFSTEALPERERVPMLREFIGPVVARLDIEPLGDGPLRFEMSARAVPELAVSTLAFSPVRSRRTRGLIADGNDNCLLSCLRSPANSVAYRGSDLLPGDGVGTLLSMADPFVCSTASGVTRGVAISVPRKVLSAMVPRLEDSVDRTLVPSSEALRLLTDYVGLFDQHHVAAPELRRHVVSHVHDLVALALGASRDAAEVAGGRGLRGCTPSKPTSAGRSASRG